MSVPDTNTFTLKDVTTEIFGDTNPGRGLQECFTNAVAAYFDPAYEGSKDSLYNFRNYGPPVIDLTLDCYMCLEMEDNDPILTNDIIDATGINDAYLDFNHNNWSFRQTGKLDFCFEHTNNTDNKAILSNTGNQFNSNDYSVSVWINGSPNVPIGGFHNILGLNAQTTPTEGDGEGFYLGQRSVELNPYFRYGYYDGSVFQSIDSSGLISDFTWHHLVVVRGSGRIKVWINGSKVFDEARTYSGIFPNFWRMPNIDPAYYGKIDQWALWTRGLSDAEVGFLNNSNNGRRYINW